MLVQSVRIVRKMISVCVTEMTDSDCWNQYVTCVPLYANIKTCISRDYKYSIRILSPYYNPKIYPITKNLRHPTTHYNQGFLMS